jgi:DNA-binding SARP family transcriptional activator/TolB-like protein
MLEISAFGPVELRGDGGAVARVLAQPKRLALLLYLTLARPRRYHRRDTLLALMWPELDEPRARKALSQSLSFLRRALPDPVLQARGADEVGVEHGRIRCDAIAFEEAIAAARWDDAIRLYSGELLAGLHVPDAPAFESWLDLERERLRELASGAAWSLAHQCLQDGELVRAERAGQSALHLVPTDESPAREFIRALAAAGDRAAALRFYEKFAATLAEELEVEPARETAAVAEAIRYGNVSSAPRGPPAAGEEPLADGADVSVRERRVTGTPDPTAASAPDPTAAPTPDPTSASTPDPTSAPTPAGRPHASPARRRLPILMAIGVFVTLVAVGLTLLPDRQSPAVSSRVAVLPFENRTGESALDPLGVIAADWITAGLARVDTLQVVSTPAVMAALAEPGAGVDGPEWVARQTGAGLVVRGTIVGAGDSLELRSELVDPFQRKVLEVYDPARSPRSEPALGLGPMQRQIVGRIAARLDIRMASMLTITATRPPNYDAYRAYITGVDLFAAQRYEDAIRELDRAWAADSNFTAPGGWIASAYWNMGQPARQDSVLRRLRGRRAHLVPIELAMLDILEAQLQGDNATAYRVASESNRRLPSAEGRYMTGMFALRINRVGEAARTLAAEPQNGPTRRMALGFHQSLVRALHCLQEYEGELRAATEARTRFPDRPEPIMWQVRALIGLGRIDDALQLVDEALTLPASRFSSPGGRLGEAARELRIHGYPGPAEQVLRRALGWYRANAAAADYRFAVALALETLGRPDSAVDMLRQLASEQPESLNLQGSLALALVAAGHAGEARLIDQRLAAWTAPYVRGAHLQWRARIAAQLGEEDRAMALLRDAVAQGVSYADLYEDERLQPLRHTAGFRRFMQPPRD